MWLKYDDKPIFRPDLVNRAQDVGLHRYSKPRGFWITDDGEDCWRTWCLSERFGVECLSHKHEIILDESRVLILRSEGEVRAFARKYRGEMVWGPPHQPEKYRDVIVDWKKVSTEHAGVIITPYQWGLRLRPDFSWYYCWDCSPGCIWDVNAIIDVRLIEVDHSVLKREKVDG